MPLTSRPSQNSPSVIWPVITKSRCNEPNSGLLIKTFLRKRKSLAGSLPVMTGVVLLSLESDGALETEWCGGVRYCFGDNAEDVGLAKTGGAFATLSGVSGLGRPSVAFLLRLMMEVSSCLNFSRSATATDWDAVKVKLWPVSSPKSASFSLTWADPSLLQKRAIMRGWVTDRVESNKGGTKNQLTCRLSVRNTYGGCFLSILCPLQMGVS